MFSQPRVGETNESPARVLVVDDEPLIRWSIAEALTDCGYTVVEAGTGRAAIQETAGASCPIGVIVLDFRLPDADDLSLLRRLRSLAPGARIILMTAHGSREVAEEARALGAYGFVNKPFDMSAMASLVTEASRASIV
jgi:DNA-binding NtrC family response regulator